MHQPLTPHQQQLLKARAHKLKPIVLLGHAGLTENVVVEIDRALEFHELIKVKIPNIEKTARQALAINICEQVNATCIQILGGILTLYRRNPDKS